LPSPKTKKKEKKIKKISLNSNFYVKIECFFNFFLSVAMSHLIYPSQKKEKKTYSNLWRLSKKKFLLED